MQRPRIAILGASGYAGVELSRLIALHPEVELAVAGSDRWADEAVEARIGVPVPGLHYTVPERALEHAASCTAVLLATPAEISHAWVPQLVGSSAVVIDLSGAFRLRDAAQYARHYKFVHQHAGLLADAVYGLPELHRQKLAGAKLIANPGCYATAIQLALAPIAKLADHWAVSAVSGVTGAGRKATEDFSFVELAGDVRAYRSLRHQHAPEIAQGLGMEIAFVPHLIPVARGILATCHARGDFDVAAAMRVYAGEAFVELTASADDVSLHHVVGTNKCRIGWTQYGKDIVVTAAIDNLVKGAAGQAVQNLNLALGFPETTGLVLRGFHP
ncbi:MAG: N-acetyl-gamma-glutamyl-phosphate reductase [Kofleriaceae bacterium]